MQPRRKPVGHIGSELVAVARYDQELSGGGSEMLPLCDTCDWLAQFRAAIINCGSRSIVRISPVLQQGGLNVGFTQHEFITSCYQVALKHLGSLPTFRVSTVCAPLYLGYAPAVPWLRPAVPEHRACSMVLTTTYTNLIKTDLLISYFLSQSIAL